MKTIEEEDEAGSRWAQGVAKEWAAELEDLVAAGFMRKGSGVLPSSFWKMRRSRMTQQEPVAAVSVDRDKD